MSKPVPKPPTTIPPKAFGVTSLDELLINGKPAAKVVEDRKNR